VTNSGGFEVLGVLAYESERSDLNLTGSTIT
jgi:hypothetical protein